MSTCQSCERLGKAAFLALAFFLAGPVASAAEAVWPRNSTGEFAMFVTLQRYQIQAEHCAARIPDMKSKFDALMEGLNSRVQGVSRVLIASDQFAGMKDKPVPPEIVFAFQDILEDTEHNVERHDAVLTCPGTLQELARISDESLRSGLTQILTAVQKMIQNLEREGAR
jgi:hypothetical protein